MFKITEVVNQKSNGNHYALFVKWNAVKMVGSYNSLIIIIDTAQAYHY